MCQKHGKKGELVNAKIKERKKNERDVMERITQSQFTKDFVSNFNKI